MPTTAAADGTAIAYEARGHGPALLFTNGFSTSTFYWQDLLRRFDGRARCVTWDIKGHGASAPACTPEGASIAGSADDLMRVMDAAGLEKATLLAFSVGCQIVFEAWRRFPDRIEALVPILGSFRRPFDTLFDPRLGKVAWQIFRRVPAPVTGPLLRLGSRASLLPGAHRLNQLSGMVGARVPAEQMRVFYEHLGRIDAATWLAIGRSAQAHDAGPWLDTITVPTLVVAGGGDTFTPGDVVGEMADRIPNAELLFLQDATHTGLFDSAAPIGDAIEGFLVRHGLMPDSESAAS